MVTPAALRRQRDRILRKAGFTDIEDERDRLEPLIRPRGSNLQLGRLASGDYEALGEYYRRAGHFLHEHQFASRFERRAWELHAEGKSYTEIARAMRSYRKRAFLVVTRLRDEMLGRPASPRRPPGRPRNPASLRAQGMEAHVRLDPAAALALDQVRAAFGGISAMEAMRRAVVLASQRVALRAVP